MRLDALLDELTPGLPDGLGAVEVTAVTSDSRKVAPGGLFVALAGAKADGARFAGDAVGRGAVAVLAADAAALGGLPVPVITAPDPRRALAIAAARLAGPQPGTIVAVTGTSGKTSIAAFVRQIWADTGKAAASIGTIGVVGPKGALYGSLTTPDPVDLAGTLAGLAAEGVSHVALEASSHGLDQRRLDGVRIGAGAFTNLSRDHLDYHPTVEAYFAAKMRLFDELLAPGQGAVVDVDTEHGRRAAEHATRRGLDLLTVGRAGTALKVLDVEPDGFRQIVRIAAAGGTHTVRLPLLGTFQVSNALVAAGLAIVTGTSVAEALAALEGLTGASGRLDLVGTTAAGAPVFVDYAHKPDALEKVLEALRPFARGRLIAVFGCGGDRDPGKRPIMGEIASRLADVAIVTDDNPRSEDPAAIRRAILAAAPGAIEIGDRAEAIRRAVGLLKDGDILVIAGKGHETGQIVGDRVLPFSDHDAARAALAEVSA
ncbi:UDP-N-acetylmuramoylalanyl-D-glutamate--2,6-diaminopimelate ligase [Prosthecomicrobium hirschii]|uniref:UDP-N-acetylmuramoyl-L-alanyl-D-glutamate--2,6-diaminopimelate ligase n=1 Tax=Prosthecodimorpha hirschii TaxID=665126 RepID=A0A0P6W055_9HYPH|nr:UDP-N-acetylmuramoyl-L-alanyl-D-glutamate--2,6-diaminopimelate ligase [Prosthecomicrobium hirschii]KPL51442.1 UDP-N-acetylmuramoylalanyl-D-glutamate--2,6-diaminopimelate ligase [Prosthecomicrobium hirschii]